MIVEVENFYSPLERNSREWRASVRNLEYILLEDSQNCFFSDFLKFTFYVFCKLTKFSLLIEGLKKLNFMSFLVFEDF